MNIRLKNKKKKDKCPECGKYTGSVHDKLKPIELKYLKIVEYDVKVVITKRYKNGHTIEILKFDFKKSY